MGAPWPNSSDLAPVQSGKKLAQLHYEPKEILFQSASDIAQIRVVAEWEDGEREDVTCLTRFRTNNDAVAAVNESGLAKSTGKGDTHIVALYDNGIAAIPVLRPLTDEHLEIDVTEYSNPIDRFVVAKLVTSLALTPLPAKYGHRIS